MMANVGVKNLREQNSFRVKNEAGVAKKKVGCAQKKINALNVFMIKYYDY